jgi:hypothetical protein
MNHLPITILRAALVGTAVAILAGCAGSPSRPTVAWDHPVYLPAAAPIGPGYRYYPDYEVFHSFSRGHFVYQEGEQWVAHAEPPRVSREVLFASPSMAAGFQSGPVADHSSVVRLYPQPRILVMSGIRLP